MLRVCATSFGISGFSNFSVRTLNHHCLKQSTNFARQLPWTKLRTIIVTVSVFDYTHQTVSAYLQAVSSMRLKDDRS